MVSTNAIVGDQPLKPAPSRSGLPVAWALIGLAILVFGLTAYFFMTFIDGAPAYIAGMFALAVLVAAALTIVVLGRLAEVLQNRRVGIAGSRMHTRLVGVLSLVAILPTVIAFFFSALILQTFSQEFFVDRVDKANSISRNFANTYFNTRSTEMGDDLVRVALDLSLLEQRGLGLQNNPIAFRQYLFGQAVIRDWAALYLLDGERRVLMRVETVPGDYYQLPSLNTLEILDEGSDVASRLNFDAQDRDKLNLWRAVLKIRDYEGGYLIAYKGEAPLMTSGLLEIREFRDSTTSFNERLDSLRSAFTTGYSLLAFIILLLAVWMGLRIATTIVAPIGRMAGAAERISSGDLTARVNVQQGVGELEDLGRTFNHMAGQLETQRDDLISSNKQSDTRRRFIEAVLSGVSAGVLGVSQDGRITAVNKSASEFMGVQATRMTGMELGDLTPDLAVLLQEAKKSKTQEASGQIELKQAGTTRVLNVRISGDITEEGTNYVVTFDDISELISAQRNAAWGDVARRIAHEIKNPLTPIQLSAERLKRKYGSEITSNREVFDRCTDTIIRHVNDIGRMVNEFSSFARMPEAVMARENVNEIIKSAVFPFQVAHTNIEFSLNLPAEPVFAHCDGRLLVQACTNLVKNAAESIDELHVRDQSAHKGKILIRLTNDNALVRVEVIDNGLGLPEDAQHRLTEPYMTTREKGTGLGLAIVRKVIEEHQGKIILSNDKSLGPTGASVSLVFPGDKEVRRDKAAPHRNELEEPLHNKQGVA